MTDGLLVVGGGVAGLVVARRAALGGARVTVLERSERLGGQVARQQVAGVWLDAAAESFATRGAALLGLLAELGLDGDVVSPSPSAAWLQRADGTAVALPATGVLGIPAHPLAADVVTAIGRPAAWRAALDRVLPSRVGADAASLGELVRRRMGRGVAERLVAPVVRGVHSRHPDAVRVEAVSPRLREELRARGSLAAAVRALRATAPAGTQVAGIRGGVFRLVDALVADCERLGVVLRTGAEVTEVLPDAVTAGGARLDGRVVLAAPDPRQPAAGRRSVTLVTLVAEAPALDDAPRGTGVLVAAAAPGVDARALTHLTAKWDWVAEALPGLHAVRLSYDDVPADAVGRAVEDARTLLGAPIRRLVDSSVATWDRSAVARDRSGIVAVGEEVAGTGLASVVAHAERVGAELAAELGGASRIRPTEPGRGRMER